MIAALLSYLLVLLLYWMLQTKLRELLWRDLDSVPQKPIPLIVKTIKTQWMTLSPRNLFFQAQINLELGIITFRESLLLICMNRLSVKLIGLMLLLSLMQESVIVLLILGGALLFFFSKKLKSVLQILFLAASFLVVFQFSFYTLSKWIYSSEELSIVYLLSDARWPVLLGLIVASAVITVILKLEFALLILSALLFFSGALPVTNAIGLLFGELLGWMILWTYWAKSQSQLGKSLFLEALAILMLVGLSFLSFLLMVRGAGWLNIRIMGGIEDKKILFFSCWALLEVFYTIVLMLWGHFRFQLKSVEPSDIEPLYFNPKQFHNSGWIFSQTDLRLQKAQKKLDSLQRSKSELTADEIKLIPKPFFKKMLIEVETLKSMIEQLKAHT